MKRYFSPSDSQPELDSSSESSIYKVSMAIGLRCLLSFLHVLMFTGTPLPRVLERDSPVTSQIYSLNLGSEEMSCLLRPI